MQTIPFNQLAAKNADAPRAISQTGKYIGGILTAEMYETESGAEFIELIFKDSETNALARINTCIRAKDGTETRSMGQIQALMGIVGAKEITPTEGTFLQADGSNRKGYHLPELEKKRCGLLLQRQNDCYTNKQGEVKEFWQMVIASVFDSQSEQTYHEKEAGKPAKSIDMRLSRLTDYDTKRLKEWRSQKGQSKSASAEPYPDEDIPF